MDARMVGRRLEAALCMSMYVHINHVKTEIGCAGEKGTKQCVLMFCLNLSRGRIA